MAHIFISYNRKSEARVKVLADDMEALGHTVWFDQDLSGGQTWWDKILATIRETDIFVFALSPEALQSTACKREYHYASRLGKPILPIQVTDGISTNLLPPALSQLQIVDYRQQDRDTAFRLGRALANIPPPKPLPDPLPPPPDVPLSYLGGLTEQLETASSLSYEAQSTLLLDLKRGLRNAETAADARTLLGKLRERRDILMAIAEEIDEVLKSPQEPEKVMPKASAPQPPLSPQPLYAPLVPPKPTNWMPVIAGVGGVIALLLAIMVLMRPSDPAPPNNPPDTRIEDAQQKADAIIRQAELDAQQQQQAEENARKAAADAAQKLAEQLARTQANTQAPVAQQDPAPTPASDAASWYRVNAKPTLRVRASPSETGAVIGSIPDGGKIKVLGAVSGVETVAGRRGQWVQVQYQTSKGYAFSGFLSPLAAPSTASAPPSDTGEWFRVKAKPRLNVRSSPDVTGAVIASVDYGKQVKVLDRVSSLQSVGGVNGYWVKVEANGKTGFAFDAHLEK